MTNVRLRVQNLCCVEDMVRMMRAAMLACLALTAQTAAAQGTWRMLLQGAHILLPFPELALGDVALNCFCISECACLESKRQSGAPRQPGMFLYEATCCQRVH